MSSLPYVSSGKLHQPRKSFGHRTLRLRFSALLLTSLGRFILPYGLIIGFQAGFHRAGEAHGKADPFCCGSTSSTFTFTTSPEDNQALYLRYPTATPVDTYIITTVKIESGAKSALDPNSKRIIRPYLEDDVPSIDLTVGNVTTVDAQRTFWDKIVILHGLRRWFDIRGELKGDGQRVSRHYYDACQLWVAPVGQKALQDRELGIDCLAHARMFFNRPDFDLATAAGRHLPFVRQETCSTTFGATIALCRA